MCGVLSLQGRITVCNLATVGTNPTQTTDPSQRKLYIGGLSYETSNEALISIFSQYGEIEEGSVAYDKNTNRSR
jgi:RNA recognition motif-containing protein